MEDHEIISLYYERSEDAIVQTEKKYGGFCHHLALNILSDYEDAEECVNDTWLAAWNRMPPTWPASLRAFLGRITRNLSISRFRKNRAKKRYAGIEVLLSELGECVPESAIESEVDQQYLSDIIIRWLDGLTDEKRFLFVRRYWYGDSVKELAARQGLTADQMARKMQKLRKSLRKTLEMEGVEL